ncbi:hypothetical protein BCR43DRAFT_486370 [Syncephalastrum racemosum]|uniref:Uncharacterized protein n=1 Tax=Syncephalastrum racemosum TaxID=13706 RepID=A0A1X2HP10_SYNRA|nr:hypothetical protein BCR43DRAFT_486370 [Syncephalastrum racemosum]
MFTASFSNVSPVSKVNELFLHYILYIIQDMRHQGVALLAQSVERETLNLKVGGSSPP